MTEVESHLLTALVTEYLTKEAPDTAREFQCLLDSPSPVASCSFRLEDAVQHFYRTAPSKGNQLGLKDGHARRKMRKRKKVERPSSGEEKVLKVLTITYLEAVILDRFKTKTRQLILELGLLMFVSSLYSPFN